MKTASFPAALLSCLAGLILAGSAFGQTTGAIRGTVKDPSAAVVVGAKLTATSEAIRLTRSAVSDSAGDYEFAVLPVGRYTLEVEVAGFKKYVQKDIDVSIGHVVVVDPQLQLGSPSEVVIAESGAPLVETTSTQLGAVVNDRAVTGLPLNARDTYQLLQLQPGVQSQIGSDLFYGSDRPGVVSVNGGRGRSNNFTVNGGEGNDMFANLPQIQPSPDTIEEFRVLTNTFDAEFGRNSGAVVNVVTKSGTNDFHGNLFEFFRNKVLNARGFFDTEKSDFKQNQFGGTFGGPIKRDRTFFFTSYEGRRVVQGISGATVTVPSDQERLGDFSAGTTFAGIVDTDKAAEILNERTDPHTGVNCAAVAGAPIVTGANYSDIFPGNIIPTACMDPVAVNLLSQFVPRANRPDGTFQAAPIGRDRSDQFTVRVDHKISEKQQFGAYYYFTDRSGFDPFAKFQAGGSNVPGFGSLTDERIQQLNLTHTWALSPATVNEFRFAYFREGQGTFLHPERTNLVTQSCDDPVVQPFCFTGTTNTPIAVPPDPRIGITPGLGASREGVPFITISGGFNIGNNFEGELPQTGNTFQWADNFTKIFGKHTTKFGADIRNQRFDQRLFFDVNGEIFFFGGTSNDVGFDNLFPNYLLGFSDQYLQGSAQDELVRSNSIHLYAQDSWKIKSNLTLNYGLRWELNTPLTDIGRRVQTFRPGQATTIYPCVITAAATDPVKTAFGVNSSCDPGAPNGADAVFPLGLVVPGDQGIPGGLTQTYFKAFAPRVGLAWSPGWKDGWLAKLTGGPGRTSIRMGWGLFYNPVEQLVLEQFSAEPPFGGSPLLNTTLLSAPFFSHFDATKFSNPFNGILDPPRGQAVDWSTFRPIILFGQFQPNLRTQYSAQYNFTIQRQITNDILLQVGYVGSQGHRLLATHDLNFGNAQTCLDLNVILGADSCGPFFADVPFLIPAGTVIPADFTLHLPYGSVATITGAPGTGTVLSNDITLVGLRPFSSPSCEPTTGAGCPPDGIPIFSSIFAQDTIASSDYNSLQVLVEKRFSHGLQLQAAYTWSKSFDNASSFEGILNPLDIRRSRSLSQFDARHRFVLSWLWELPIPRHGGAAGKLLNGWAVSGIATFQSGFPIRITSQDDIELMNSFDFELPGQPDLVGTFRTQNPRNGGCAIGTGSTAGPNNPNDPAPPPPCDFISNQLFDPTLFTNNTVPLGGFGNSARTICCGPGINNFDVGIHKNTPLTERTRLEFRAEFFNLVNHTQFTLTPGIGNITNGSDFGRINSARNPRLIQFAMKLFF